MADEKSFRQEIDELLAEYDSDDELSVLNLRLMRSLKETPAFTELPKEYQDDLMYVDRELEKRGDDEKIETLEDIERNSGGLIRYLDKVHGMLQRNLLENEEAVKTLRKVVQIREGLSFTDGIDKDQYPNIHRIMRTMDEAVDMLSAN